MGNVYYFHAPGGLDKAWSVWNDPLNSGAPMVCSMCEREPLWVMKWRRDSGGTEENEAIRSGQNIEVYLYCDEHRQKNWTHIHNDHDQRTEYKPIAKHITLVVIT